ncbi:MAG: DUF2530 domain-containing protein [Streptosporangiaceae bacterium]
MKQTREPGVRLSPPPPLEGNDQLVTRIITAGWAIALIVLLIERSSLRPDLRWWIWTCVAGLGLGLFALWYLPRLKRSRSRAAQGRGAGQSAPRDSGSNTVSSTETPGRSTRS